MPELTDKVVFITGGSSGYGKATAKLFAQNGSKVIIASRNKDDLIKVKEEINCFDYFVMDVTNPSDWQRAADYLKNEIGGIDILINNAGGGVSISDVTEQSIEEIDKSIKLNLNSVIYGSRAIAPLMKEKKSGTIINISSVCAKQAWPGWTVYSAAKAGVLQLSKGLYVELQPYNIRVSCVIPAAANTNFQKSAHIDTPRYLLTPCDIANTIFYICSLPQSAVVEEVIVWGIDQQVIPL